MHTSRPLAVLALTALTGTVLVAPADATSSVTHASTTHASVTHASTTHASIRTPAQVATGHGHGPADRGHGHGHGRSPVLIDGAVTTAGTVTAADLAALPVHQQGAVRGVSLFDVVSKAGPVAPAGGKNGVLRLTVTAHGAHGRAVTFALAELDPEFGRHDAVLVTSARGKPVAPAILVPGDADAARSLGRVRRLTVAVGGVDVPVATRTGDLVIKDGRRNVGVSRARLEGLPQVTARTSYLTGKGAQVVTETGPTLQSVLRAARVRTDPTTAVVGVAAADGYAAAVTPGESTSGGRPVLVSLVENGEALPRPRLAPIGDFRGGRYVTDLTGLYVQR